MDVTRSPGTRGSISLNTPAGIGELYSVPTGVVKRWVREDAIPSVSLPDDLGRTEVLIPLQGLLATVRASTELNDEVRRFNGTRRDRAGAYFSHLIKNAQHLASHS